jgi:hypothetical protein
LFKQRAAFLFLSKHQSSACRPGPTFKQVSVSAAGSVWRKSYLQGGLS